jgi:hypothetical protein
MGSQTDEGLSLLGLKVRDKVTGIEGVITSVSFDLYGCVQGLVNTGKDSSGNLMDLHWFDISRLTVKSRTPVMKVPDFGRDKGPEAKPVTMSDHR